MSFEIIFNDLTPEAKARFLEYMGINDPLDGNYEFVPIAIVDYNEKEEDKDADETVASNEVDGPCDCGDCEHADRYTENSRYDFDEDEKERG